jgi:hypothetical protein
MSNPKFLTDDQRNRFFSDKFFRYIFGRKPNLSRDRTVLVSYLASIEKADPESLQLMLDAGIGLGQIEAAYEIGVAPSTSNFDQYSPQLLDAWLQIAQSSESADASRAKRRLSPRVLTDQYGIALTVIYEELNNTIIRLSHILHVSTFIPRKNDINDLFLYYLSRTVQVLRSIRVLINNDEGGIILSLCRYLFECYAHFLFLNRKPDAARALILPALIDERTYEHPISPSGKPERDKVINTITGQVFKIRFDIPEILRLCQARREQRLYEAWYPHLWSESHLTTEFMAEFFDGGKFRIHRDQDDQFTIINLGLAMALLTIEIVGFRELPSPDRRDVLFGAKRLCRALMVVTRILKVHDWKRAENDLQVIFGHIDFICKRVLKMKLRQSR